MSDQYLLTLCVKDTKLGTVDAPRERCSLLISVHMVKGQGQTMVFEKMLMYIMAFMKHKHDNFHH